MLYNMLNNWTCSYLAKAHVKSCVEDGMKAIFIGIERQETFVGAVFKGKYLLLCNE